MRAFPIAFHLNHYFACFAHDFSSNCSFHWIIRSEDFIKGSRRAVLFSFFLWIFALSLTDLEVLNHCYPLDKSIKVLILIGQLPALLFLVASLLLLAISLNDV